MIPSLGAKFGFCCPSFRAIPPSSSVDRMGDELRRRADRAEALVQMGELSAGRAALEGASLAPGNETTRRALVDQVQTPIGAP